MTEAILGWQAVVFVTIALAGRARGWVAAGWVLWTIVQVITLPLSILQFLTIGLAYSLFSAKRVEPEAPGVRRPTVNGGNAEQERAAENERRAAQCRAEIEQGYARMEALERKRARRAHAVPRILACAAVATGSMLWMEHSDTNILHVLLFSAGAFGTLWYLMRILD